MRRGAVYSPAMTDFIFMVDKTSYMFVTGPDVVKTVTHEEVTKDELGGAQTHNEKSGVAHFLCDDEDDCLERVRELLFFLPDGNFQRQPKARTTDPVGRKNAKLKDFIPVNNKKPYDMKELIMEVVDGKHFLEYQKDFAKNIICGFAQVGGSTKLELSPTNQRSWQDVWTSTLRRKRPVLCAFVTLLKSRFSPLWTFLASFLGPLRSMEASFDMGRSFFTLFQKRLCL